MLSSPVINAISSADDERLRKTLIAIIADPHGKKLVENELLIPANHSDANPKKRNKYEHCRQCGQEFEFALSKESECSWHSGSRPSLASYQISSVLMPCLGECDVDWDSGFWDDTDDDIFGPIDTDENREEYPEGFVWTCCGGQADAEGCKRGFHKQRGGAKRARA
ncbi:uncharacterized protein BKCO1_4000200 [Diplodia corticola]|uniref:C2H2-type domain-containing protein n=1 Tax=Diplodia corticola TaxID=236234 RepID=A0A1J9RAR4_9PEZI|nr:uncharacterized protein BKCO1_4000200 [Diplodia corticola]OJD38694.1 hypothetical protein BKCO1_4000200 [Diplodia corticola]